MRLVDLPRARGPEALARVMQVPDVQVAYLGALRGCDAAYLPGADGPGVTGARLDCGGVVEGAGGGVVGGFGDAGVEGAGGVDWGGGWGVVGGWWGVWGRHNLECLWVWVGGCCWRGFVVLRGVCV